MDDASSALKHFDKIAAIARGALPSGWALFRHDYDYLCFGSFSVEFGTRKKRMRYSWDGREGFLDIQEAHFSDSRSPAQWKPAKNLRLGFTDDEPYTAIEADLSNEKTG